MRLTRRSCRRMIRTRTICLTALACVAFAALPASASALLIKLKHTEAVKPIVHLHYTPADPIGVNNPLNQLSPISPTSGLGIDASLSTAGTLGSIPASSGLGLDTSLSSNKNELGSIGPSLLKLSVGTFRLELPPTSGGGEEEEPPTGPPTTD